MELVFAFIVFVTAMLIAVILDFSMVIALIIGLVAFSLAGMRKGYSVKKLASMAWDAVKESVVVLEVMVVIGFITAAWRVSGTITVFVYYGMKIITPSLFLLITFLLSCLLSYALGTSFGVAGTVGVIFLALARSGGVDPVITAGVVMSGIYFGDRSAPASSSANLVAGITGTGLYENVKKMMRTGFLPFVLCLMIYGALSVTHPISHVDMQLITAFEEEFSLSPWAFVPAILMLVLPLLKVGVIKAMGASIFSGILVAWLVQGTPLPEVLKICVLGYQAEGEGLSAILNGGGLVSMVEILIILTISATYSGIFTGTAMLEPLQDGIRRCCGKLGRFPVMVLLSIAMVVVFCNQTIATMMCCDLMKKPYLDDGGSREELAIDMENSVIVISGLVPWAIACSVPLSFMGVGLEAIPYSLYLYFVPLCYLFTKSRWYGQKERGKIMSSR